MELYGVAGWWYALERMQYVLGCDALIVFEPQKKCGWPEGVIIFVSNEELGPPTDMLVE